MTSQKLSGLIAAGFTPLHADGQLNLAMVPQLVEHLISQQVKGIYVCGSTGEGPLLTGDERRLVTEAYIKACAGRLPIIVQVGHNSIEESCELAAHAASAGADYLSACSPGYFKPDTVKSLVTCMGAIAATAPDIPFYYYHIPRFTGAELSMVEFLRQSQQEIPSLAGIKYSDLKLFEFQECLAFDNGRYDILWGCDEMLLGALATGAKAAVGSTYNFAAPVYYQVIDAFQSGDIEAAQAAMLKAVKLITLLSAGYGPIHSCMKSLMGMIGHEIGPARLPFGGLSSENAHKLKADLTTLGFFDWISPTVPTS